MTLYNICRTVTFDLMSRSYGQSSQQQHCHISWKLLKLQSSNLAQRYFVTMRSKTCNTMTLTEGEIWQCCQRSRSCSTCVVTHHVTKYHCAKFDVFSFNCFWEKWQTSFFDLCPWPFWTWHSGKVIVLCMMGSVLSLSAFVPNVVPVALIVSEKYGNVTFCDPWPWPFLPWTWVKVIMTHTAWSASWQSTIMPNLVTVALIVSEKS